MGAAFAQHIAEEDVFQLFRGDRGHFHLGGNGDRLTGLGGIQSGLGGGDVKLRAHLLGNDGVGGSVIARVFHHARHGVMNFLSGPG